MTKVISVGEPPLPTSLYRVAQAHFAGRADATLSHPRFLEFVAPGVSKGRAVAWLAHRAGIPLSQVMTIGDAYNDLEMISDAGHGAAMASAPPEVRLAARYIAAPVEEDGSAALIEQLVLADAGRGRRERRATGVRGGLHPGAVAGGASRGVTPPRLRGAPDRIRGFPRRVRAASIRRLGRDRRGRVGVRARTARMRALVAAACLVTGLVWTAPAAAPALAASTINVPADYATLQAAIDAAAAGDTIKVAAGTYAGHATVDKTLTIESTTGAAGDDT